MVFKAAPFLNLIDIFVPVHSKNCLCSQTEADDGVGFKWSLAALRRYLEARGVPWDRIWTQCKEIVAKALIAAEPG